MGIHQSDHCGTPAQAHPRSLLVVHIALMPGEGLRFASVECAGLEEGLGGWLRRKARGNERRDEVGICGKYME